MLSESLYMDNLDDCRFLLSEEGRRAIVRLHVEGIFGICNVISADIFVNLQE